ncbi:MAG: DUF2975 domain-containing protein [Marinomonas sp.]
MSTAALSNGRNDPLLLAGRILTFLLQAVIALGVLALAIATPIVIFARDMISAEIIAKHGDSVAAFPAFQIAVILVAAIAALALIFLFFGKLRALIESVGIGDPFAPENADRLSAMGWLAIGVYALSAVIAGLAFTVSEWAQQLDDVEFDFDVGLDLTGILMIIILFILARVFRHGASMREDLEGTV